MKMRFFLTAVLASVLYSCSGTPEFVTEPQGNTATINMKNGKDFEGELLCIYDSSVIILSDLCIVGGLPHQFCVSGINIRNIRSIELSGYTDRSWIMAIVGEQLLPGFAMAIAASGQNSKASTTIMVITVAASALTALLFETSTESPVLPEGYTVQELKEFHKYFRYPGGLTDLQIKDVLTRYHQDKIIELK
jgi:hypothetical protein